MKKSKDESPESDALHEIRLKILEMTYDENKTDVAILLEEMNDLYFNWIDRILEESRDFLVESEVVAIEEPDSNVVHVKFGRKEDE